MSSLDIIRHWDMFFCVSKLTRRIVKNKNKKWAGEKSSSKYFCLKLRSCLFRVCGRSVFRFKTLDLKKINIFWRYKSLKNNLNEVWKVWGGPVNYNALKLPLIKKYCSVMQHYQMHYGSPLPSQAIYSLKVVQNELYDSNRSVRFGRNKSRNNLTR